VAGEARQPLREPLAAGSAGGSAANPVRRGSTGIRSGSNPRSCGRRPPPLGRQEKNAPSRSSGGCSTCCGQRAYLPEVTCRATGRAAAAASRWSVFSADQGGVVCRNCEGVLPDRIGRPRLLGLLKNLLRLPRAKRPPCNGCRASPATRRTRLNRMFSRTSSKRWARRLRLMPYVLA